MITDKNNHFIRSLGSVFQSKAYITLLLSFLFNSAASKVTKINNMYIFVNKINNCFNSSCYKQISHCFANIQ